MIFQDFSSRGRLRMHISISVSSSSLQPITMASTVNLCVGAVVALGGVMGYAKKRSIPSLAAGGGAGLLYIVAR